MDDFELEQYFAKYEFSAKYLLGSSDAQTITMKTLFEDNEDEESLQLWNDLNFGYTESTGLPVLKQEVASMYEGLVADDILMFAGAEEAIYATMRALLKPDEHVVVILPAYQSLLTCAEDVVGKENCTGLDLVDREGKWVLPMKRLKKIVESKKTKMMIMNFPHNPTGALISHEEQLEIVEMARANDVIIFFDEVYRGLELNSQDRLPQMCTLYEKAFSLGVMSKSLGLPGLRIGWLASKNAEALRKIGDYKHYLSICNSAPSEVLSLMALRCQDKILARIHDIIRENLVIIDDFLAEFSDLFVWNPPVAGCIGLMHIKGDIDIDDFAQAMLQLGNVMILPGYLFPSINPDMSTRNTFRFGFGRSNFKEAMSAFSASIRKYRGANCSLA